MANLVIKVTEKGIDAAKKSLDKLDNSAKKTEKDTINLGKAFKATGTIALGAVAGTTALTAAVIAAANAAGEYAKEVQIAAQRSGESVETMQLMAAATKTVGIDLEKLGDIGKDTQEKIGDFLSTGGGGFQDFVDTLGLTGDEALKMAEKFSTLSGPDVLQEMVNQMQAAGVSTQQMSFALEGMASDTTDLIPLLIDGGAALDELTAKAEQNIKVLTETDISKLTDIQKSISGLGTEVSSVSNKLVAVFGDDILKITESFSGIASNLGEGAIELVGVVQATTVKIIGEMTNLFRESEIGVTRLRIAWNEFTGDLEEAEQLQSSLASLELTDSLMDESALSAYNAQLDKTVERIAAFNGQLKQSKSELDGVQSVQPATASQEAIKVQTGGNDATAKADDEKAAERVKKEALREAERFAQKQEAAQRELELIHRLTLDEKEIIDAQYNDEIDRLRSHLEQKLITQKEFNEAEKTLRAETQAEKDAIDQENREKELQAQSELMQARADAFGSMADIAKTFSGEQSALYKTLFATSKAFALADSIVKIQTGIANAAALPFPANLGAMATVGAQTAGIISTIQGTNFSGRLQGGDMNANQPYRMAEQGTTELIVPKGQSTAVTEQKMRAMLGENKAPTTPEMNVQVNNVLDAGDLTAAGLRSAAGTNQIMNIIRENKSQINGVLGS